ncbi:uncharacterized protein N7515_001324 [Penicillium bovifimosum]|uniref:Transposase IS30-like HTH domain-containing protein n=1 Tax=Penicillium bovifimosum TaxID=126998 RepID=A0A9W9H9G5_9EURO|nr:uncharacterized protein N7515_001324 [Penicillium bovifimosum]KAJ5142537.1 hypothetical protein N7515_001324 [Penicillium bovifimosum]
MYKYHCTTPANKQLSRDERIKILPLRKEGNTSMRLSRHVGCTKRQVQHVCNIDKATPRKGRGSHLKLSENRVTGVTV